MRHSENDFAIPALKALYSLGGKAMMSDIKDKVPEYIELSEEDKIPFVSRTTRKEARYRQVVGNITSHHNDTFFRYAFRNDDNTLELNDEGRRFISSLLENDALIGNAQEPDNGLPADNTCIEKDDSVNGNTTYFGDTETRKNKDIVLETSEYADSVYSEPDATIERKEMSSVSLDSIDQRLFDIAVNKGLDRRPNGDAKIRDVVLEICQRKCQYAVFTGTKHKTFVGQDGKAYVEAHHLIPLSARKDFFPKNLDRATNLVCLCPTCHNILHHGTKEGKTKILRVLYDRYIDSLNEEQIYITFEQLINKYYVGGQ